MKKLLSNRFLAVIALIVFFVMTFGVTMIAAADTNPYEQYYYKFSKPGIVISEAVRVYSEPSESSTSYGTSPVGYPCKVLGTYEEWSIVDLSLFEFDEHPDLTGYGFIKSAFVIENPYWIVLNNSTRLYSTPWETDKKENAEISGVYLIIEDHDPFYAVKHNLGLTGTSFVYKSDVGQYTREGQVFYVVVKKITPLLATPGGEQTNEVYRGTVVLVDEQTEEYLHVVITDDFTGETLTGWIKREYLQIVVN